MILKTNIRFILLQLLLIASNITLAQGTDKVYNHELATSELEETQTRLKAGESFELNPELFEYIYLNINTFPSIPIDAGIEERMQSFTPIFNQLTFILKSLVIESRDSISVEHAMIIASLGYQSVNLLSLGNEYMETLDKSDPTYTIREKGYNRATSGIQDFLIGYIITTFLENKYEGVDSILTSSLIVFAPKIMNELPKDKRKATTKLIKKYIGNKNDLRLNKEYQELLDVL
ncbi:hypothetical protein [Abyssalbus ytuae]|uniref:Uncharacterized protein n=1 Tax=Abyssalbus ytuae TaxID=2926907 RepID=A0A9E6ZN33_9FLAO|nr:hypothetical protein [Abyssalbus ytuae]UOB18944.1 hypothetical protein MQE35_06525 [Abyssalbus ytuae]